VGYCFLFKNKIAIMRRSRAVEMLEASLKPRGPPSASPRPTATKEPSLRGHGRGGGGGPAAARARQAPEGDRGQAGPSPTTPVSAKPRSIYQTVDAEPGAACRPQLHAFDLEEMLEKRTGGLGKNVYQSKVADKVVVLEAKTASMASAGNKRRKDAAGKRANGKMARTVRYDSAELAKQLGISSPESKATTEGGSGGAQPLAQLSSMWQQHFAAHVRAARSGRKVAVQGPGRMDWHGARAVVVEANCPTLIGLQGVIARETKHTLVLVDAAGKEPRLRQIPKAGTVLHVDAGQSRAVILHAGSIRWP